MSFNVDSKRDRVGLQSPGALRAMAADGAGSPARMASGGKRRDGFWPRRRVREGFAAIVETLAAFISSLYQQRRAFTLRSWRRRGRGLEQSNNKSGVAA
jgi:hypothetical protein